MIELELQLVGENPHWLTVLQAYQAAHDELAQQATPTNLPPNEHAQADDRRPADAEDVASEPAVERSRKAIWLPRLTKLAGIEPEELSRTHGRLIAYGLLKCDLADRSTGVVYQLTSTARQVIERSANGDESPAALDDAA